MDWVIVSLVVAPVLAVGLMLYVVRVVGRVEREVQTVADHVEALRPPSSSSPSSPSSPTEERPSGSG